MHLDWFHVGCFGLVALDIRMPLQPVPGGNSFFIDHIYQVRYVLCIYIIGAAIKKLTPCSLLLTMGVIVNVIN